MRRSTGFLKNVNFTFIDYSAKLVFLCSKILPTFNRFLVWKRYKILFFTPITISGQQRIFCSLPSASLLFPPPAT